MHVFCGDQIYNYANVVGCSDKCFCIRSTFDVGTVDCYKATPLRT